MGLAGPTREPEGVVRGVETVAGVLSCVDPEHFSHCVVQGNQRNQRLTGPDTAHILSNPLNPKPRPEACILN